MPISPQWNCRYICAGVTMILPACVFIRDNCYDAIRRDLGVSTCFGRVLFKRNENVDLQSLIRDRVFSKGITKGNCLLVMGAKFRINVALAWFEIFLENVNTNLIHLWELAEFFVNVAYIIVWRKSWHLRSKNYYFIFCFISQ